MPVCGLPVGDELVRHELKPRPFPQPQVHPLLRMGPGSPVYLRGGLRCEQEVRPFPDFNVQDQKVCPEICPPGIDHDITNLPGAIKVMRAKDTKRPLVKLIRGNRPAAPHTNAKLKPAHWRCIW
ncbi:hypothetical protein GCM10009861_18970 [Neomicrococcus aestuarii]